MSGRWRAVGYEHAEELDDGIGGRGEIGPRGSGLLAWGWRAVLGDEVREGVTGSRYGAQRAVRAALRRLRRERPDPVETFDRLRARVGGALDGDPVVGGDDAEGRNRLRRAGESVGIARGVELERSRCLAWARWGEEMEPHLPGSGDALEGVVRGIESGEPAPTDGCGGDRPSCGRTGCERCGGIPW